MRMKAVVGTLSFLCWACSAAPVATSGPDAGGAKDAAMAIEAGPDVAQEDAAPIDAGPLTASACFADLAGPVQGPDYDQFKPVIQSQCAGTHQQQIAGVEKLVFVGDSITTGTPPNLPNQIYRTILANDLVQKFGPLDISDCSAWGARMRDLLDPSGKEQLLHCLPNAVEQKRTLVIMTMGGNDIASWAKDNLDVATATAAADDAATLLRQAVAWVKDPARFPNGSYFVFANDYEYTDTSGDLLSCPAASLAGFKQNWPQGAPAVVHFQEQLMKAAVDYGADLVFLLEHFCGHGYRRTDPTLQCYRGPNAELWFDLTCIHPNPTGHAQVADLFQRVIDG
jgi:lysophospholipase L1-like esterase